MAAYIYESLTSEKADNLSLYSFPAHLFLSALPHWWSIHQCLSKNIEGGWRNQNPRSFVAQLNAKAAAGKKLSVLEKRVLNAQAAQQNGFEWFGFLAAAVLAGNFAKLPAAELNRMSLLYIVMRVLYNIAYIHTHTFQSSLIRTVIFNTGVVAGLRLIFKAAQELK